LREDDMAINLADSATQSFQRAMRLKRHTKPSAQEKECELKNIGLGDNKLFGLFQSPHYNNNYQIGFFQSMAPDILHNFYLGVVRDVIGYTMTIIDCVAALDNAFSNSRILWIRAFGNFHIVKHYNFFLRAIFQREFRHFFILQCPLPIQDQAVNAQDI
jgi:hypothetical protein